MTDRAATDVRRFAHALALGAVTVWLLVVLTGCGGLADRFGGDSDATSTPSPDQPTEQSGSDAAPADIEATSQGVLNGRLVDAVTGLPVSDAGVSLLGRERRTISAPDGRFRFDGLQPGALTVVIGPVPDYVSRSLDVRLDDDGTDLGVTPLLPTSPPTLILPEYGGVVVGCEGTQVQFATESVAGPSAVSVTCLDDPREYPAPPPAGRLPLAVVDLAPGQLLAEPAARLSVALPVQPRFSDGVPLDLLRLDLDRLVWVAVGSLMVEPGGMQAAGDLDRLGSYMIAAPPLGADFGATGTGVQQFQLSAEADGPPADVFPTGTVVVYATYDYTNMTSTPITTRAFNSGGAVVFEETRTYDGRGSDSVPMLSGDGAWTPGEYNAAVYVGEPATHAYSIAWRVASAPTEVPPTLTLPSVPGSSAAGGEATQVPVLPASSDCGTPSGWYAYVVQKGDTLSSIARRTGTTVARLQKANCLQGTGIYAGSVIYVPGPPSRPTSAAATRPVYATAWPTRQIGATRTPPVVPSWPVPTSAVPGYPTSLPTSAPTFAPTPPSGPTVVPTVPTGPTNLPPTTAPPTAAQPTQAPPTQIQPTQAPPTQAPPTQAPPTQSPPTFAPPTQAPPTQAPPTQALPTQAMPTQPAATQPVPEVERPWPVNRRRHTS